MHPKVHPVDIILHKRDGLSLTETEIREFVRFVVERTPENPLITDAQIASFLMAVQLKGLDRRELAILTSAMRFSGEVFDSRALKSATVDKHSTGGVGDKTSLLVAPIVAAAGLSDPMISGRSLGHTGGTLDKLETIPGFRTNLSLKDIEETILKCGFAMAGQTPKLVPADRILYALRDHTGTTESLHLIAASVMSKKLAEDLNALVLDVKTGSGAFMTKYEESRLLGELMVATGEASGTRTVAVLTAMEEPLGRFAGNWVEVWECVDILRDIRHDMSDDLIEVSTTLAGWMLYLGDRASTPKSGIKLADHLLRSGDAYQKWLCMVEAQGGDVRVFEDPAAFHKPTAKRVITAAKNGYLSSMDCKQIGWAIQRLGAGRAKPGDPVSAHAGIEMHAKLGAQLKQGQPIVTLFSEDETLLDQPEEMLNDTLKITDQPPMYIPLIREVITKANLAHHG